MSSVCIATDRCVCTATIGGKMMKELYNAPVLELVSFVANERLASGTVDYGDFGSGEDEYWTPAEESTGDMNYDFAE